jgi:hypothetical protein
MKDAILLFINLKIRVHLCLKKEIPNYELSILQANLKNL